MRGRGGEGRGWWGQEVWVVSQGSRGWWGQGVGVVGSGE